jgi:hypothetical protein
MVIENEIRQPLQTFGLMTGHRVQGASFQSRVGVFGRRRSAASDRVGLNSSAKPDARRGTNDLRGWPPTTFQL